MKIYPLEHDEVYSRFSNLLRKERVAIKKDDGKTNYLGLYDGIKLIGVVGWQKIGEGHIRLKTDYIRKEYRGKGGYSKLWKVRWNEIVLLYKPKQFSAFCTEMSLPKYIKEGFTIQKKSKNGIVYVKRAYN